MPEQVTTFQDQDSDRLKRRTRLAPSPTGALHLGNARTFLINYALAKQQDWEIVLRIEDLDHPRAKPWAREDAMDVLSWLGLTWDAGPITQTDDLQPCHNAIEQLYQAGLVYPCGLSRNEIESVASAPQEGDHQMRYPNLSRHRLGETRGETDAWRLVVPDGAVVFHDGFVGECSFDVQAEVGDFLVSNREGQPAYQLAVVVDDARQGVTDVVRADDLLSSTARQIWLYRLLELGPVPNYVHVPMVIGEDGRRLAKRHGDTRVSWYREKGASPERLIGLLAYWCGLLPERETMTLERFIEVFDLAKLPRDAVVFGREDDRWLLD